MPEEFLDKEELMDYVQNDVNDKKLLPVEEEIRNQDDSVPFMYDYVNRIIRKRPEIIPYSFEFGDTSNYFKLSPTGHFTLNGSATTFDDLRIPGLSVRTNASAPDLISFAPATTNLLVYGFDGTATSEQVYFTIQLPHSYKEGSDITPHVHWSPTDTNSGDVKWNLEYSWANYTDESFPVPSTIDATQAASGTAWQHQKAVFDSISGTGKKISSMLVCRLYRDPSDAEDTYEHDAAFLEIDFHYEQDTLGSQTVTSKT